MGLLSAIRSFFSARAARRREAEALLFSRAQPTERTQFDAVINVTALRHTTPLPTKTDSISFVLPVMNGTPRTLTLVGDKAYPVARRATSSHEVDPRYAVEVPLFRKGGMYEAILALDNGRTVRVGLQVDIFT